MNRKSEKVNRKKTGPKVDMSRSFLKKVELLAMLGATDRQIAEFFEKDVTTIESYIKNYPQFKKARKAGGLVADLRVVQSLFKRAIGYDFQEEQMVIVQGQPRTFKVKKHIPPDLRAITLWMTNRQRENWTNTSQVQHGGTIQHQHQEIKDIKVEELSPQAQAMLFEIGKKQLTDGTRNN